MSFIEWDSSYKLSVSIIDQHHQKLVNLLNTSYDAIQLNNKSLVADVLSELVNYTAYHFSTEEQMMHTNEYPQLLEHTTLHSDFIDRIRELQSKLKADEALYDIPIVFFLKDWLVNHILVTDRELADYLVCQGVN